MAMMMTIAISASAMTYKKANKEALFLSDKMAYELKLSSSQYEAVFEINLDYIMAVNKKADISGSYWKIRDTNMRYVLTANQYRAYHATPYFYNPLEWTNGKIGYKVYAKYNDRNKMYRSAPNNYKYYKGGGKKDYKYFANNNNKNKNNNNNNNNKNNGNYNKNKNNNNGQNNGKKPDTPKRQFGNRQTNKPSNGNNTTSQNHRSFGSHK